MMGVVLPSIVFAIQKEYEDPEYHVVYVYDTDGTEAEVKEGNGLTGESGSPNVSGEIKILDSFNVDGKEYIVSSIGYYAFFRNKEIHTVELPETITTIKREAFLFCSNMTSINIPNSVTKIDDGALSFTGLRTITLPKSLKELGIRAFINNMRLRQIVSLSENPPSVPFLKLDNDIKINTSVS